MKINRIHARARHFADYVIKKYPGLDAENEQSQHAAEHGVLSVAVSAKSSWNGQERRSNIDRRQQTRRQYRALTMLDTRTQAERRCGGRRKTDRFVGVFVACKV